MKRRTFVGSILAASAALLGMRKLLPVRVYRVTEDDYVAARSLDEAVGFYCGDTGVDPRDHNHWDVGNGPEVVSDEDMDMLITDEEAGYENTFDRHLRACLADKSFQVPFHFASYNY